MENNISVLEIIENYLSKTVRNGGECPKELILEDMLFRLFVDEFWYPLDEMEAVPREFTYCSHWGIVVIKPENNYPEKDN